MSHVICQSLATYYKDYVLVEGIHSNPEQLLNRFFLKPASQPSDTQSSGTHQLICLTKSVTEHVLDHFIVGVWWIFIRSLGGIVMSVLSLSHHISKKSYQKHLPLCLVLYLYLLAHISIKTNHRGYWKGGAYRIKKDSPRHISSRIYPIWENCKFAMYQQWIYNLFCNKKSFTLESNWN